MNTIKIKAIKSKYIVVKAGAYTCVYPYLCRYAKFNKALLSDSCLEAIKFNNTYHKHVIYMYIFCLYNR